MDLLKRRQLLWYFGLGIGAAAVGIGWKKISSMNALTRPISPTTMPAKTSMTTPAEKLGTAPIPQPLPEFQGISQWLNSPPLQIADLKGKVVLIQFWTFACINCQRTLPYITRWHREYQSQGLQIIGIHAPEFPYERDINNIQRALQTHQITYPVPLDNEFKTWNAYENQYWPHLFLADRQGNLQYDHIGEGSYQETEQMIRQLLG